MNTKSLERLRLHIVALETDNRLLRIALEEATGREAGGFEHVAEMYADPDAIEAHWKTSSKMAAATPEDSTDIVTQAHIRAGEVALASSRAETIAGQADLLASEAALASSRAETVAGRGDLLASETALASSRAETIIGRGDLLASETALASSRAETVIGRGDLLASETALASSRAETMIGRGDLLASETALASSRAETMIGRGDLLASETALASSRAETMLGRGDLLASESALASSRAETMVGRGDLLASETALASSRAETILGRGDLLASETALASSRAETMIGRGDLLASETALASSRAETMIGRGDLLASETALASSRAETVAGRGDLLASETALASSRAETILGRGDLLASETALASSRAETMVGRGDLLASETALASSRAETRLGRGDLLASEAALASARAETLVGRDDLLASRTALASSRAETKLGRGDLLASEIALASSRAEMAGGRADLLASETALTSSRAETKVGHADLLASRAANTDLDILARELQHLAHHDPLTDLPNRSLLRDRVTHAIDVAARSGQCLALMCLDLDCFKAVNDLFGHAAGDALLILVTKRLQEHVRASDTLARVGGDEFVVVATFERHEPIQALAGRLIAALAQPFLLDIGPVQIGVSIGIAVYPADGTDQQELMRTADVALYRAKEEGRDRFRFFDAVMDEKVRLRHQLECDLRGAIDRDELALHYQPMVDAASGQLIGFEALLRWNHPEHGFVPPLDFIALAEDTGLILKIGEWVLETACRAAVSWAEPYWVAVNISPVQFLRADLAAIIASTLARTGLPARRLEVEITEGILMKGPQQAAEVLTTLRALGVRIAMDDFGTGYSSLSYLNEFKFDKLKIDRSFVKRLVEAKDAKMIVRAIIGLAHNLDLLVVAEGVETAEQLDILRDLKCDQLQGYLIGRPMPIARPSELIAAHTKCSPLQLH